MSIYSKLAFRGIATLSFIASIAAYAAFSLNNSTADLKASELQSKATIEIIDKLDHMHYASQEINDHLSSLFFDNYIDRLDSSRSFFLASDIAEFEAYRHKLDDSLKAGSLDEGFLIYNRYQKRVRDRIEDTLEKLPTIIETLDFNRKESLLIDRTNSPWPKNDDEADDLWRKLIKSRFVSLRLTEKEDDEIIKLLTKRYQNQLNRIDQSNSEDAFQVYINSFTELYDPHTNYLSPRSSENFNINMSLQLQGIGAVLQQEDEYTKVVRLVPAGPAFKQGDLQPSDKIIGVAQGKGEMVDVIGMRLDEVVDLIRGEKDSIVHLEVIPVSAKTDDEHKVIKIRRDTVKLEEQSAQRKILDVLHNNELHKVGVIDLPAFYRNFAVRDVNHPDFRSTSYDVVKHIKALGKAGAEGIIIDLRDNGGGSLEEANALTSLFIESGATVQIRNSDGTVERAGKNYRSKYFDMPLVVLINRLSASASEIFAGAIQDYNRGLIVGTPSFGKGTVQSINDLTQGQLKITQSKFYRVSGESTQHRGVVPDIIFPALYDMEKVGESSLDNALPWDTIAAVNRPKYYNIDLALPPLRLKHDQRTATDPDFVFMRDRLILSKEARDITHLPLNIEDRRRLDSDDKVKFLAIENKRRQSKGLKILADLSEKKAEESEKEAEKTKNNTPINAIDENDPVLNEASQILFDSMPFYRQQRVAKTIKK